MISKPYKVRTVLIFIAFCFLYTIIAFNLLLMQIMQRTYFTQLGQQQHEITITFPPDRAPIFDRTGTRYLALNKESIAAFILPRQLEDSQAVKQFLKKYFPAALERLSSHTTSHFMYVKRRLSPYEIKLIEQKAPADIKLLQEPSRYYPLQTAASVVGITDIDNAGSSGIELAYNTILTGTPAVYCLERDAYNTYFKKELKSKGDQGMPLTLTIDSDLQFLAYEELRNVVTRFCAKEGGVIIMDPNSGDILAMVSYPTFDPNNTGTLCLESMKNKCVTEAYELGSVIKVCAAMAALEEGVVTPDEPIDCKGVKTAYIEGRKINTWKAHGIIPFEQVIAGSNNIGIAQVAQRVGPGLYDHYVHLGFGQKTTLKIPGEQKGFVNHPKNWSKQSCISLSYGYEVSATLLQLARAFSLIANGGYLIEPRIILTDPKPIKKNPRFKESTITTVQNILEKTTLEGTAHKAAISGYRVMSKTGTANLLENGHYNPDRNIYTCAGIVEKGTYQRVIVTFVKEAAQKDLYASTVAAPLFERIAEKIIIHEKAL